MAKMPVPDDWDGLTWKCCQIEWPASLQWWAIFLGFITTPATGRFWDEETGSVLDSVAIGKEIEERNNCLWESTTMGCNDETNEILQGILGALQNGSFGSGGCGGSGGAGGIAEEPSEFVDNGSDFPSGYDDAVDYRANKCNLAQYAVDQLIASLKQLKQIDVTTYTLGIMIGLLPLLFVLPIAYVGIVAVAETILGLAALGISAFSAAVQEAIDWLEDDFDICRLYVADDAATALDNFHDDINAASFTHDTLTKQLLVNMVTTNLMNILFSAKPGLNLPESDCSECEAPDLCAMVEANFGGSGAVVDWTPSGGSVVVRKSSISSGGYQFVSLYNLQVLVPNYGCCYEIEINMVSGYVNPPISNYGYYYNCNEGTVNDSQPSLAALEGCRAIVGIRGHVSSPYVVDITITPC